MKIQNNFQIQKTKTSTNLKSTHGRFIRAYNQLTKYALSIATVGFFATPGFAYVSVQDTADVLPQGTYRASFEPQFIFSRNTGTNLAGRIDSHLSESTTIRGLLGVGSATDFFTGAYLKWAPIPDVDKQPAIAGQFGIIYSRYSGEPEVSFRFNPIVSKRFETERGAFTPYGSIPLAIESRKNRAIGTAQLALGTMYQSTKWKNVEFSGELGLDIKDSYTYVGVGVHFFFDGERGFSAN